MKQILITTLRELAARGMSEAQAREAGAMIDRHYAVFTGPGAQYEAAMKLLDQPLPAPLPPLFGRQASPEAMERARERQREWLAQVGRTMWAELHRWALTTDLTTAGEWLDTFANRLPCGDCRKHWRQLVTDAPPDLSSNAALFAWTWARHAEVNEKLGKPQITLDEARKLWA